MLEVITALLSTYRLPAVFVGAFFFGDSVIFTTAYLAGQLAWPPFPIIASAFLGTAAADTLWFFAGSYITRRFSGMSFMRREREKAAALLQAITGEKPFYALVFIKFLYGSRIAMILYVAARGIPFRIFSIYNAIGILAWLAVFFPLGYLAGIGIGVALPLLNAVQAAVVVLLVSAVSLRIITIWVTRRITRK